MKKAERFTPRKGFVTRTSPYPFQQIADDGGIWQLKAGEDYSTTDRAFQGVMHSWARRQHPPLRARTRIPEEGVVEVRFTLREPE
jgi:hypothetical protein